MAISYVDPFTGSSSNTCSVAASYAAKAQQTMRSASGVKTFHMSEAQWEKHQHLGTWGVIKGKHLAGDLPDLPFATYKIGDVVYKVGQKDGKLIVHNTTMKQTVELNADLIETIVHSAIDQPEIVSEFRWLGQGTPDVGPVKLGSKSVGSMTDEDVAALFVKTKDDFAAAKGINIKGVNPQLDKDVYEAIAKQIGYSPTEVKAKVDAYKASGKKLSALKKKVKAGKAKTVSVPKKVQPTVDLEVDAKPPFHPVKKVEVPVEPAKNIVDEAMDVLESSYKATYSDEEVAKAYIKAKDQLSADPSNPWTLYTQNNSEFEDAISHLMSKNYDINLSNQEIRKHVADYLGQGNKLSVLKKKMAKQGEYVPQADTLKGPGSKAAASSKTAAKKQIDELAGIYNPTGAGGPLSQFYNSFHKSFIFDSGKNEIYSAMNGASLFDKFDSILQKVKSGYAQQLKNPNMLDMVRIYDEMKADALGIDNGFFYEKKLAEYASSPSGKAQILAKKEAKELEANLPPLPADSQGFQVISTSDARHMQDAQEQWTAAQIDAIKTYTGDGYTSMNGALRQGRTASQTIKNVQAGMRVLPRDMLVHRGASFEQFGLGSYEQALQSIGKTVIDEGFLSTSVGGSPAFGGSVKFEIELPKGTSGSYVDHISRHRGENELIVAAGTKFKVLTVTKQGYQTLIRVRAIPGSHMKAFS